MKDAPGWYLLSAVISALLAVGYCAALAVCAANGVSLAPWTGLHVAAMLAGAVAAAVNGRRYWNTKKK